jgi:hypothetical protein
MPSNLATKIYTKLRIFWPTGHTKREILFLRHHRQRAKLHWLCKLLMFTFYNFLFSWAADLAIRTGTSFIFVVADDFRKHLLNNELMRHNFQGVCTENMTDRITSDRGLIITIQKIREMIDAPVIQKKQVYIFDDMDHLLDKGLWLDLQLFIVFYI